MKSPMNWVRRNIEMRIRVMCSLCFMFRIREKSI
jgi:hypothetical protein